MNPNLILTSTVGMTQKDWLKFRNNGIGGSEVATVLNLNPYQSAVELFYRKVQFETDNKMNERMFWGKRLEGNIADVWQYWENDFETTMKNFDAGQAVRHCEKVDAIIQNPEFLHLFANIDRIILSEKIETQGVLEIKNASSYALLVWESEIPPYFIVQIQSYMAVTGLDYAELAILKNGNCLEVYPFKRNEEIIGGIIEKTKQFWGRVIEARQLLGNFKPIEHLEPEPDNSEAYEKFMKERFTSHQKVIQGAQDTLNIAYDYKDCTKRISEIQKEQQGYTNNIISAMRSADKMDFGVNGYITYNANKNGDRKLNVRVK